MEEQPTATTADDAVLETKDAPRQINSVDATTGQPIVARVLARKAELEALLERVPEGDRTARGDIELALSTINDLMTGDLEHVPAVVVVDMNRWLERTKHLGERVAPAASAEPAEPAGSVEPSPQES